MSWLNHISIKSRILIAFFFLLLLFIAFGVFSLLEMKGLFRLTQNLYDHPFTVSNAAQRANTGVIRMHRTMKDVSSAATAYRLQQAIIEVQRQERLVYENLEIVKTNILGIEGKKRVQETIEMFAGWKPIRMEVKELVAAGRTDEAHAITQNKGADYVDRLERQMMGLSNYAHNKASDFLQDAEGTWESIAIFIIILIGMLAALFALILGLVLRSINTNISDLIKTMSTIQATGNLQKAKVIGANEITDLSNHFNSLIDRLEDQVWLRDGLNSFNEELSGNLEYDQVLDKGIAFICKYVEACLGAVYSYSETDLCSTLATTYAFVERGHTSKQFKNGEGIIGQIALKRQPILLKDIERIDAEAVSGTMAEPPRQIYSLPLIHEKSLLGVLEIASFSEITASKRNILDEFANILSTFAHAAKQNRRIKDLFEITKQSNQALEKKSTELNETNLQLSSLNDELQIQADELKVQKTELVRQRHQVEEADRLKSEFLSNMSHELRTPLNSVLALSQLMIRQGTGVDADKEKEYLHVIERNGRRLLSLINDILDLSKIEAGGVELKLIEFNPTFTLNKIMETVIPLVKTDQVSLELECKPDLNVFSDEDKVHQIMLNLVSNAIKFTDKGIVKITISEDENWLSFAVQDSGIGIEAQEQSNIFNEFRQVDGSLSRRHEGTGLGLAISQKLAHKLGGLITVQSEPGKGSLFTLKLPHKLKPKRHVSWKTPATSQLQIDSAIQDTNDTAVPSKKGTSPIVLVIDDEQESRHFLRQQLANTTYRVFEAANGREGLAHAKTLAPHLIILDILMPEMDGFEVIRELKSDALTEQIPVVVVSTSDDKETGMALGASRFLTKPAVSDELLAEIESMVPLNPSTRILIVDDDPIVSRHLTDLLSQHCYQVEAVETGRQALARISTNQPDMVILDLMMPEMDGFMVLQQIRNEPDAKELPVLILTAKDLTKKERNQLRESVHGVLSKADIENSTLMSLVEEIADQLPSKDFETETNPVLLVVEDNEIAALQVQSILKKEKYSFLMANGGLEAVEILQHNTPDAVILDLMMPEVDGFQVLEKLRLTPETKNTPVLVLTAKELTEQDRETLTYNHIQELVQKGSVNREQFLAAVTRLFGASKNVPPHSARPDTVVSHQTRKPLNKKPEACTLLVVEDNPDNLVTLGAILDTLNYNYLSANDGQVALQIMKNEQPDLVLMDVQLPGISGIEAVRLIREDEELAMTPVICLTARAMKGDKEHLLKLGFDDYVAKPIDPDKIRLVLKKWIDFKKT